MYVAQSTALAWSMAVAQWRAGRDGNALKATTWPAGARGAAPAITITSVPAAMNPPLALAIQKMCDSLNNVATENAGEALARLRAAVADEAAANSSADLAALYQLIDGVTRYFARRATSIESRWTAGLLGALIGDALGVPYEFKPAAALPALQEIEMVPPAPMQPSHGVPPGTWSDDGAHLLAFAASLLAHDRVVLDDLGQRLLAWYEHGAYTPDGVVFDIGMQTRIALQRLRAGVPAIEAGPAGERDNGNGALMRVLPLALWHLGPDIALVADAHYQSLVTHGHAQSQVCCALYCLWARYVSDGEACAAAWSLAYQSVERIYQTFAPDYATTLLALRAGLDATPRGTGYVVDTLAGARWACTTGESYADVVRLAIGLGGDTDTTACVAGGIAGIIYGVEGIPGHWRACLRGRQVRAAIVES